MNSTTRAAAFPADVPDPPRATYRLQLNKDFAFPQATAVIPYLSRLGISHLYLSPILKARAGSVHGYDVTDHSCLNPELGTLEEFTRLCATAHAQGLGIIVDFVPNHMAVMADDNAWWLDVLENGPGAEHAPYFDIDWQPLRASMANRLLVPVLGEPYGKVLDKGEIKLVFEPHSGSFALTYYAHRFPLDPREYPSIFASQDGALKRLAESEPDTAQHFKSLLEQFGRLPRREHASDAARAERYRDKEAYKRRLAALYASHAALARLIDDSVSALNGTPNRAESFDALHALIEAQAYRLAYWRVAGDEINYRRFFDVDHLAAIRMDDPRAFEASHRLILQLIAAGHIDALRIDHPDGLYDPQSYLERLQRSAARAAGKRHFGIFVEKILAPHERLSPDWPVAGTTGYDFAALTNAWLNDSEGEQALTRLYENFTGNTARYEDLVYQGKKLVMRTMLAAEVAVLSTQLDRLAQQRRDTTDFTRYALRDAIIETIACFPVYRSYISERGRAEHDPLYIDWALQAARRHSRAGDLSVFDFLRQVLLEDTAADHPLRAPALEFTMKFQQVTAAVTAKGVEDTTFYRFGRLSSLNEVGGSPLLFSLPNAALHESNLERQRQWPQAMLATSTHDTKRSEDVRARLAVLSELPLLWRKHLARWNRLNKHKRQALNGESAPSAEDEYLLYQSLVGVWPVNAPNESEWAALLDRMQEYTIKAAREAKDRSSWINQNTAYEQALRDFLQRLLERPRKNAFVRDLAALAEPLAYFGMLNGVALTALKLAAPGVPDLYQGMELPQLSLVDPDNRRPVSFQTHESLLSDLQRQAETAASEYLPELLQHWRDGRCKLFLTWRLLQVRQLAPELFAQGEYEPLKVDGQHADRVLAFRRRWQSKSALFVIPRHMARLTKGELKPPLGTEVWGDTRIRLPDEFAGKRFTDLVAGHEINVSEDGALSLGTVLKNFPVAALVDEWWAGWGSNPRQTP